MKTMTTEDFNNTKIKLRKETKTHFIFQTRYESDEYNVLSGMGGEYENDGLTIKIINESDNSFYVRLTVKFKK